MKSLGLIALLVVSSFSSAQSRSTPYTIYLDGVLSGVGFDLEHLLPYSPSVSRKLVAGKGCVKITASQNGQSLRMLADATQGTTTFPKKVVMHQCLPSGGGVGGGQVSFALNGINGAEFPPLNLDATEAAYFELEMETQDPSFAGFAATTPIEKDAVKAQKTWLPSNFRLKLGDMPTGNVSRVGGFSIKNLWEDLDGDGAPEFVAVNPIRITFPVEDAPLYNEWYRSPDPTTTPGHKTLRIIYNDSDGAPVLAVTVDVTIVGLGFVDLFLGPDATPGREVTAVLYPVGKVRVDSWASVIE